MEGDAVEGEVTGAGVAEEGVAEEGPAEAGSTEALEDSPASHPVNVRAAEATTAAITEARIPNLFQRMCPFPFLFVFAFAFVSVLLLVFAFSSVLVLVLLLVFASVFPYCMPRPRIRSPRASALGTHPPACRPSTQTERAGAQVLLTVDL
ncbi:hypothetical protein ACWD3J_18495 [Streptomyces sp. NPDC002755]|uniref:hypothetical protein n=1 Tax=Streptomyces sp. NPDC002884 TaxID=3154544 RepID=UPI00332C2EC0